MIIAATGNHTNHSNTMTPSSVPTNHYIEIPAKSRPLRLQRIALIAITLVLPSSVASFTLPTPITQHRSPSFLHSQTCCAAAAASAWLFTPERTGAILADTVSDVALKASQAAADVALDAAIVTTDTVVKTVYKAPFLSLALSFLLGGLFFSTVAAGVAAAYAFGKENTRRFKEVAGILWKRNWQVFTMSLAVTRVSTSCSFSLFVLIPFELDLIHILISCIKERFIGKRTTEWLQKQIPSSNTDIKRWIC